MAQEQSSGERGPGGRSVSALVRWLTEHRLDLAILVALTAVAGSVRLTMLVDIPAGLHGDEAWTGIDAVRILDEGWIGPYVTSATGQASGPLYFAAPFVALFGETVFSIRLASAVLGIGTVLVTYLAVRVMFDRTVAVFAAIILAVGVWHLHYSRLAFPVISWPLFEMLTLLFLFLGIKTGRLYYFAVAGLAFGGGIYTYNAYPVFVISTALFITWIAIGLYLAPSGTIDLLRRYASRIAVMAAVSLIVTLPMILYATDLSNDYFDHAETISLFQQDEWEQAGLVDRIDILRSSAWEFYETALWTGRPDGADGAGQEAMVDRVTLVLLILGALILLVRWRRPAGVAVLLMVLILPMATMVTIQGTFRQTLGVVPFLAILAAVPLALWWQQSDRFAFGLRYISYGGVVTVVGLIAFLNLSFYFDKFPDTNVVRDTFTPELVEAIEFMSELPEDQLIYFYSDRWSFDYETRRYLAPRIHGVTRAQQHQSNPTFAPDDDVDIVYVLLGEYVQRADEIAELYPGGTLIEGEEFRAYLLPLSVRTVTDVPGAGALGAARDRDAARVQALRLVSQALESYRGSGGSYPATNSTVETLCAAPQNAGCVLTELIETLPADPLGDPSQHGYWYASDGNTYELYAQRESDAFPVCTLEHPEFLQNFGSLLCVLGP